MSENVTIYAFADGDEGRIIHPAISGRPLMLGWPEDELWEDNDFDGLSGLVVWEGVKWTEETWPEEKRGYPYPGGDDYEWWAEGSWRPMRTDEAVRIGLLAHGTTPAPDAEARVRELEAALNDALAEMEAGDAPDMRWLPANPSDLFGMVSNRYRSVYAILDAARQAGEVEDD